MLLVPYYFNHEMAVVMAGAQAVAVPTTSDYQLNVRAIAPRSRRARGRSSRSRRTIRPAPYIPKPRFAPSTPSAATRRLPHPRRGLRILHLRRRLALLARSLPDAAGHTISLFSLSKAYGMASWRIGCMVIPEALAEAVRKIQDTV